MNIYSMTNEEVAKKLAASFRAWRVSKAGAALSQADLAKKSGVGLTPIKRFEKTGATTLGNLIAMLRAMDLLEGLMTIMPDADDPGPLEILAQEEKRLRNQRRRAPRKRS